MARHSHPYHFSYTVCVSSRVNVLLCVCFLCTCHKHLLLPQQKREALPREVLKPAEMSVCEKKLWLLFSLSDVGKRSVILVLPEQLGTWNSEMEVPQMAKAWLLLA